MKNLFIPLLAVFLFFNLSLSGATALSSGDNPRSVVSVDTIMYEAFNYPAGQLPPGWVLDGADAPWSVSNSNMSGGEAPELYLGYSFASGTSRLISPSINVTGYEDLRLKYTQYLINYDMDYGEVIGLDITFDGGQNWQSLWDKPIGTLNIPKGEISHYFSVPSGATTFQYAFRFEGNSYAINMWLIDDITLESVADNDLLAVSIAGNGTPKADEMNMYFVEILNGGNLTQTNYTVKLMMEGGIELASLPGETIAFNEKKFFLFSWTPGQELIGSTNVYADIDFSPDENPENNRTSNFSVNILNSNTVSVGIGNGSQPVSMIPYNFFNFFSLSQSLYFPEEINQTNIEITGIQYTGYFDNDLPEIPIQIFMGETTLSDLSTSWVDPATLTSVFDGNINFSRGLNQIYIPLDNSYIYKGDNLVIYSNKRLPEMVLGTAFVNTLDTASNRSRVAEGDDAPFDPMSPPESCYSTDYCPNITLFYSSGSISAGSNLDVADVMHVYPNPAVKTVYVKADETITELKML
ncbi:MAG: hypothetical protein CVU06_07335, partial [Bacteroidetes bacterium HGW-Bacteroidetes-22]